MVSEIRGSDSTSTILNLREVYILSSAGIVNVGYFPLGGEVINFIADLIWTLNRLLP